MGPPQLKRPPLGTRHVIPQAWHLLYYVLGFVVATVADMVLGTWLGAFRVDPEGKADGGLGTSLATFVNRLQPSCYRPEAQRWVPLLWATFVARLLLAIAGLLAATGA